MEDVYPKGGYVMVVTFAIFSDVAYLAILMVGHKRKELHQNGTFQSQSLDQSWLEPA